MSSSLPKLVIQLPNITKYNLFSQKGENGTETDTKTSHIEHRIGTILEGGGVVKTV